MNSPVDSLLRFFVRVVHFWLVSGYVLFFLVYCSSYHCFFSSMSLLAVRVLIRLTAIADPSSMSVIMIGSVGVDFVIIRYPIAAADMCVIACACLVSFDISLVLRSFFSVMYL